MLINVTAVIDPDRHPEVYTAEKKNNNNNNNREQSPERDLVGVAIDHAPGTEKGVKMRKDIFLKSDEN